MASEASLNPSLHRHYPLSRMLELDMQSEDRGKSYTYIPIRQFLLVIDNVRKDIVNGITIPRINAELMPNAFLKDAVEALKSEAELF
jgi:hypothetical protein